MNTCAYVNMGDTSRDIAHFQIVEQMINLYKKRLLDSYLL